MVKLKKYVYASIGGLVLVVAILALSHFYTLSNHASSTMISAYTMNFTYAKVNSDLKKTLHMQKLSLSDPLKFNTKAEIDKYCNFLSNKTKQDMIEYCTSTELKDSQGGFLGNIDMVGSTIAPVLVVAPIQSDPHFNNYADVKIVFEDVLNETICQCWEKEKPGNYSSFSDMLDALRTFHLKGNRSDSTTHGIPLGGKHFEIELTTNSQGYLWKLLVAR